MNITGYSLTKLRAFSVPGYHSDGGGVCLRVRASGHKSWCFVHKKGSTRQPDAPLGDFDDISRDEVHEKGRQCRRWVCEGKNPKREIDGLKYAASMQKTFAECAYLWFGKREHDPLLGHDSKTKPKAAVINHVLPLIGKLPVDDVNVEPVDKALHAIMEKISVDMAHRCAGWIRRIISYAIRKGYRTNPLNPAAKDLMAESELPPKPKAKNRRPLHPDDLYRFLEDLKTEIVWINQRQYEAPRRTWALALRLLTLCPGMRLHNVCEARIEHFERVDGRVWWKVPGAMMKGPLRTADDRPDHWWPLNKPAEEVWMAALALRVDDGSSIGWLFPQPAEGYKRWKNRPKAREYIYGKFGPLLADLGYADKIEREPFFDKKTGKQRKRGGPIYRYHFDMHGMRASFDTWANEQLAPDGITKLFDRVAIDRALSHQKKRLDDDVSTSEASYNHAQLLASRIRMSDAWGEFATTPPADRPALAATNIIAFPKAIRTRRTA